MGGHGQEGQKATWVTKEQEALLNLRRGAPQHGPYIPATGQCPHPSWQPPGHHPVTLPLFLAHIFPLPGQKMEAAEQDSFLLQGGSCLPRHLLPWDPLP